MLTQMFETLERILFRSWSGRMPSILSRAREVRVTGVGADDAYIAAYEAGYFEAVSDLISEGLIREPMIRRPLTYLEPVGDEVH